MTLDELKPGARIFIDANVFIYHVNAVSLECKQFMLRCSKKDIKGFTSTGVLAEVLHRLMIAEARRKGLVEHKNPVQQLKEHPDIIKGLSEYIKEVEKFSKMNITILALTETCIATSATIRKTEGLLTNDSLILAAMKTAGLSKLATHDDDFDRIPWIESYKPSDIN